MAPAHSIAMTNELSTFMSQMDQGVLTMASQQTTSTSQMIVVDMRIGFTDSYLANAVHYNRAGAEFIVNRYYSALVNVLQ